MVLLKGVNKKGFVFYTNLDSPKSNDLKKNPKADVGRNSSIYFALGLALMMFMSYGTINYKVY